MPNDIVLYTGPLYATHGPGYSNDCVHVSNVMLYLEEYHPIEPSAYCYEACWVVWSPEFELSLPIHSEFWEELEQGLFLWITAQGVCEVVR